MPTALFAQKHHTAFGPGPGEEDLHYIHNSKNLYIISEHEYVHSLIPSPRNDCAKPALDRVPSRRMGAPLNQNNTSTRKEPRPLMATLTYTHDNLALGGAPGSPPDLTNSKSSKSSSLHSSGLSDIMGPSDLSHFEEITLDDMQAPRTSISSISSSRSTPHPSAAPHSFRDLTGASKPRYPAAKGQSNNAQRPQSQLHAPGKQLKRGFTSPSAPSLANITNLAAPARRSRSPSPSHSRTFPAAPRTLSRKSSRNLAIASSPAMNSRRQSWQHGNRKSVKELEAECDDEDDELPEDAIIWNVPISPRPTQERSPAPSSCGSPPQTSPSPPTSRPVSQKGEQVSAKNSPALSGRRFASQPPSPNPANKEDFPPAHGLVRQRTNTWEDTYGTLDKDAKKLTEALEEYQTEIEHKQGLERQQSGLSRSSSLNSHDSRSKKESLPPIRKSDPLVDPFQPSVEKTKYLSRTRPSWLPPKDPKEEKKHLKEYQKMLVRMEEAERLEAKKQEEEAVAREKAERIKAEYWSTLLLPNWDIEMSNPEHKGSHRKMWWNGIPPKLRGAVWAKAIGNELGATETTYNVALEKAQAEIKELGDAALSGRYAQIIENTKTAFADLKMFAPKTEDSEEQPLHQDLVNVCIAYSLYRPDVDTTVGIHHIAALFLLNMSTAESFITLTNILNRPCPLSFLVRDHSAMTAAYDTVLSVLSRKHASLATRLATLRVEPRDYLDSMFGSLFCARLSLEHAARIMDVYTIEGDKIPPRVAVGLMGMLEGACMNGEGESVVKALREKEIRETPDVFMGKVYEAGKSS